MGSGEFKTKPTQHSVKALMSMGIQPDFLFCRTETILPPSVKTKIALFCNIEEDCIFSAIDVKGTVYEVPLVFHTQCADRMILEKLGLPYRKPDLVKWSKMVDICNKSTEFVTIALIGKYINLEDTYKSVDAALTHGGIANKVRVRVKKIDAEHFEGEIFEDGLLKRAIVDHFDNYILARIPNEGDRDFLCSIFQKDSTSNYFELAEDTSDENMARLKTILKFIDYRGLISEDIDGILIPGGFGNRGIEGKIKAVTCAREKKIPFLGICLGMQCLVIEYARNVCGIANAHSREFEPTSVDPVIELLANLKGVNYMGGTMRKGASKSKIKKGTLAFQVYQTEEIEERHRHRYEVNPEYIEILTKNGLTFSAFAESGLVEMSEITDHPWFLGGQFHPEFKSSPVESHPIFKSFISAAIKYKAGKSGK
jgi:CTP synthase